MNRKNYFSIVSIGLMLIIAFVTACATPTPTPQPTPTIESIAQEIVPFLCQPSIAGEYRSNVVARTQGSTIVQVWHCNQPFTEISADSWKSSGVEPNMDVSRACFGDWSVNTTVRFEIQSTTQTKARLCKSGGHSMICIEQKLGKEFNQWSVLSQSQVSNIRNGCPPPPDLQTPIPSPTTAPSTRSKLESFFKRGRSSAELAPARAIADLPQAIQLQPDYAEAYLERERAYLAKSDYIHALADYDQAILLKPDFADAYYARGIFYQRQFEKEKAIADFEKYIELGDDLVLIEIARSRIKELHEQ